MRLQFVTFQILEISPTIGTERKPLLKHLVIDWKNNYRHQRSSCSGFHFILQNFRIEYRQLWPLKY